MNEARVAHQSVGAYLLLQSTQMAREDLSLALRYKDPGLAVYE